MSEDSHFDLQKTYQSYSEVLADIRLCLTPRSLDLSDYRIDAEAAKKLAFALYKQRNKDLALLRLNLSENFLRDEGVEYLSKGLIGHKHLWNLDLSNNYIRVIRSLSLALNSTTLNVIDLSSNLIPDEELELFSRELAKNNHLFRLDLSCNKLTDKGISSIASAIEVNTHLTTLNVAQNKITDDGARILLESIRINRTLTSVDLGGFSAPRNNDYFRKESDNDFDFMYANLLRVRDESATDSSIDESVDKKMELLLKHNVTSKKELFVKTILSDSLVKLKRSKLMVLGATGSGKSSFCTALFDKTYLGSLDFGMHDRFITTNIARTASQRNPGIAWTPVDLEEAYKELCVSATISTLHKRQLVEKHRRDTLPVQQKLTKDDGKGKKTMEPRNRMVFDDWEQTITSAEGIADSLEDLNNEVISDTQVRKAAKLANTLSAMEFIDTNICLDAVHYCIYDFSCPDKLKAFDSFKNLYLTKHGVFVVCFNMLDFLNEGAAESDKRTEGRRGVRRLSLRSFKSFGRQSVMSSASVTTNTSGMSELSGYYTNSSDRPSLDSELMKNMFPDEKPKRGIARLRKTVLKRRKKRKSRKRRESAPKNVRYFNLVPRLTRAKKRSYSASKASRDIEKTNSKMSVSVSPSISALASFETDYKRRATTEWQNLGEGDSNKTKISELEEQIKLCKVYSPHSPLLIVGTHLDEAIKRRESCVTEINSVVAKIVQKQQGIEINRVTDNGFSRLNVDRNDDASLCYFPVSNITKVGFDVVRCKIETVTRAMNFYNKKVRLRYMNIFDSLINSTSGSKSFTLSRVLRYAKDVGITNPHEVKAFLKLFSELGMLFYLPVSTALEEHVLPMQFDLTAIVKRLASFAIVQKLNTGERWLRPSRTEFYKKFMSKEELATRGLLSHLRLLSKSKIVSKSLLLIIFRNYEKWLDFFIGILENTFTLIRWNANLSVEVQDELYLVPAFCEDKAYNIFSSKHNSSLTKYPPLHCNLYLVGFNFRATLLPPGLFHKLTSCLIAFAVEVKGDVENREKDYLVFKRYVKLTLSLEKLGIQSLGGAASFETILREDKGKVYVIISDHSLASVSSDWKNIEVALANAVRKVKSLVESYLKQVQKQYGERIVFAYTTEFCVSMWKNDSQRFKFIPEAQAKLQKLGPWFSDCTANDADHVDLDSFMSD